MDTSTRVAVDRDVCIGAGQCALAAPAVFVQDDDGFSTLRHGHPDPGADPTVREAARACPVGAIKVTGPQGPPEARP
ncbi:ferredoxin [Streptomyces sp. XM83C]|jgi:ferredoxin|uniref:Ferredoxin n=1 Tax=Streptomyces thermocoprophilus TaxID=78356 RepID=A0ABV5V7F2_9ACTN|nr:ferredoxin [Streptomyces sp. XM83C]MCK1823138.1 ferredoxin [Streptomyces sp. XM83C]